MGITGKLVRSVFSKSQMHSHQASSGSEKRKWSSSVRSYLCGEEHSSREDFASTVAETDYTSFRSNVATDKSTRGSRPEEDTASVRSSEATVNQPAPSYDNTKEKQNSTYKLFQQEDAAFIIQSAFRNFMARRENKPGAASPSRESIGTSLEVQTAHSSHIFSIKDERDDVCHLLRRPTRAQVLKIQEDWDDSTVSSVISKMRMQNRLEAAARRERALAYAFSQQLRICSKKHSSGEESNMGWSWLERWMATRDPEMKLIADDTKAMVRNAALLEEKESCGSNEVSSLFEFSNSLPKNLPKPTNKPGNLAKRSFSKQSSISSHLIPKESKDVKKVMWHVEEEKEKRKRQKQPGFNKRDTKNVTALEVALHETVQ
ncbi:protein IQ-DOMAIN 33 isoform X2 [Salvia divinorum]|uniref:Protein IQ-DOMAIN 33 isoform X2 n=1 Tax=Salvia divinorum TaxID=28513 RepID=A0ABD1HQB0_SALDI